MSSDHTHAAHYKPILQHLDHVYTKEAIFVNDRFTPPLQDLAILLHTFDLFRPGSYNHALAYIGRILLLHSPPEEAFWQLVALSQMLPTSKEDLDAYIFAVTKLLEVSEPEIAQLRE
jgi:hypothetical protein